MGVGIASVVVLMGAGVGAEQALREALEPLGKNLLVVNAARRESSALRGESRFVETLEISDWIAIDQSVEGVRRTAPLIELPMLARVGGRIASIRVAGTNPSFELARSFPLATGRFIAAQDLDANRRVAVVGPVVVEQLFLGESPLGEVVLLGGVPFEIVGVTKMKGIVDGANEDELVIIPVTTAMRRLANVDRLDRIYVQTADEESTTSVQTSVQDLLRARHRIGAEGEDDFVVKDQTAMVRAQQQASGSLSRIVSWLSALCLGLGGVGLLAVSLLSVKERYGEIGLRLAVGGRPRDVLWQFLTEAVLISAAGGVAGLAVGAAGILLGESLTRWPMALSWQGSVYPLAISVAIAVLFGAYPALRAARLDPIKALNSR
jgi:putative ABC transport system permease protein